jgi:hypothetical protein
MADSIYQQEHPVLKAGVILFGIVSVLFLANRHLLWIFGGMICFFAFSPQLYRKWFLSILQMTLFWVSFFVLGILFRLPFESQFYTFFRLILLLGFSVFLIASTHPPTHPQNLKKGIFYTTVQYFFLTFHLIPFFITNYKREFKKNKSLLQVIENTFRNGKENANFCTPKEPKSYPFYSFPNFYLSLFFLYLIAIAAR